MSANPFPSLPKAGPDEQFPELPPRDDMQNPIYLHDPGHQAALRRHFGPADTTIVLGEVTVGWRVGQVRGLLRPDLLIAFGIDRTGIINRNGYSIEEQRKAPDFVLEVASKSTAERDDTEKREGYANYGVREYWRFDPTGGQYHQERLAGDRLVDGAYVPITINRVDEDRYWGRSAALNLDLCWEYGQLRWYDPAAQRYLRTHDDEADERIAEHQARIAAEARVRELEAQLRRLQDP